jgi:WD40 repeat protein
MCAFENGAERWTRDIPYPAVREDWSTNLRSVGFVVNGSRLLLDFTHHSGFLPAGVTFKVIDSASGEDVVEWHGEYPSVIGPCAQLVFLVGSSLRVIDTARLEQPAVVRVNTSRKHFTAAAFSPDGKLLSTTSNDTTVTLWDTATWQPIRQYGWEIGRLRAVAFAPDGLTCAAGSDTGKVVLFDVDV